MHSTSGHCDTMRPDAHRYVLEFEVGHKFIDAAKLSQGCTKAALLTTTRSPMSTDVDFSELL